MNRVTWSLVALAGACGGSPTPRPARLDPATAASLTARLAGGHDRFCPGGAAPQLDVAVATTAGKVLDSWTQGEHRDGKLPFSTFEYTTTWGQIDGDGFVRLPDDSLAAIDRTVTIVVRVVERPDLAATVTLTPDFGCGGQLGAAGAIGGWGRSGAIGDRGADGRPDDGSRPAEAGQRGGHGGDGSPGGPGGPGPAVAASLGYLDLGGGRRLAILRVSAGGGVDTAVFDPAGARWGVVAFGGAGGAGGPGGAGGDGGRGGRGRAPSSSTSSSGSGSGSGPAPATRAPTARPGAMAATAATAATVATAALAARSRSPTTRASPSSPRWWCSTPAAGWPARPATPAARGRAGRAARAPALAATAAPARRATPATPVARARLEPRPRSARATSTARSPTSPITASASQIDSRRGPTPRPALAALATPGCRRRRRRRRPPRARAAGSR